jgi:aspartate/methionine/tyrosine aminotransferase
MPGLRIGWIACQDRDLLVKLERYKHFLSICNSAPSEFLATHALRHRERLLDKNRALVSTNLNLLDEFFRAYPQLFDWARPDGSCVAFPRYKGAEGVEQFTSRLVEEAGVLLLPASIYQSELVEVPKDRFRIGFGRSHTPEAVASVVSWLRCSH